MIYRCKKRWLALLFLSVQSVIAANVDETQFKYDAVYIGADIGVANLVDAQSTTYPTTGHHMSSTGIVGGGLVGVDFSVGRFFKIGLEGFGNANGLQASNLKKHPPYGEYRVRAKYNAGVRILPGYHLSNNTIGHVLLG